MAIVPDPITYKRLVLVKQLYQQAMVQSTSHSTTGGILSLIGFDLAVETALQAVVGSLDASRTPASTFQGLIQQSDQLLCEAGWAAIPDKARILHVHALRNDAQHKARYPNQNDVSECRVYCRDFLRSILVNVWGLDFDRVSLVDLVQDATAKAYLIGAKNAQSSDDYLTASRQAAAALAWALIRTKVAVVGELPPYVTGIMLLGSFREPAPAYDARHALNVLERMQETLLCTALGMTLTDFVKYKQVAGNVTFSLSNTPLFSGGQESVTADDAEFVIAYCTDAVVQIESLVGSLEAPFGSEQWY